MAKKGTRTPANLDVDLPDSESKPSSDSKSKPSNSRGRQGDQNRPKCLSCSRPGKPVHMVAASSTAFFTWYACPNRRTESNPEGTCHEPRVKWPRPEQQQQMARHRARQAIQRTDER